MKLCTVSCAAVAEFLWIEVSIRSSTARRAGSARCSFALRRRSSWNSCRSRQLSQIDFLPGLCFEDDVVWLPVKPSRDETTRTTTIGPRTTIFKIIFRVCKLTPPRTHTHKSKQRKLQGRWASACLCSLRFIALDLYIIGYNRHYCLIRELKPCQCPVMLIVSQISISILKMGVYANSW